MLMAYRNFHDKSKELCGACYRTKFNIKITFKCQDLGKIHFNNTAYYNMPLFSILMHFIKINFLISVIIYLWNKWLEYICIASAPGKLSFVLVLNLVFLPIIIRISISIKHMPLCSRFSSKFRISTFFSANTVLNYESSSL